MKKGTYFLIAIFCCLLWSSAFVVIKIGYKYFDDELTFAGMRFFFAGLFILPFILKSLKDEFKENLFIILFSSLIQIFIGYAIFYYAIRNLQGSQTAIIIGGGPIIIAVVTHFVLKDDKLNLKKSFCLLIGMIGITIVGIDGSFSSLNSFSLVSLISVLLLLINQIVGAFGNIFVAKNNKDLNPFMLNSCQMLIGGASLLIVGLITEKPDINSIISFKYPSEFYLSVLWLSIVSSLAFSLWFFLLKNSGLKISELNLFKFIVPVMGAILAWSFLPDETPTIMSITGMILVIFSLFFYYR